MQSAHSHPNPASIEDLLKTNQAPSALAAQRVRNMLFKPLKDLEDLNAEILQLKGRLMELEQKRNETEKEISQYKIILSPIRRIPSEILGEIFYRCLPTDRNPIMKSSDCPLLLTRICSLWRTIAMSTSRLWARLYITFTDYDTVPDIESMSGMARMGQIVNPGWNNAQSKFQKQETTKLLRRRYEAVKEWLSRSGTNPLSLSLRWTSASWCTVPYSERSHGVTMEFLSFLAGISPRWKDFEYKGPVQVYQALENLLMASRMMTLTSLTCDYHQDSTRRRRNRLLETPNLRELTISGGGSLSAWGITDQSSTHWKKLTTIVFSIPLSITDTIFVLERASLLIQFTVELLAGAGAQNIIPVSGKRPIRLPLLQTFSITVSFDAQSLYDQIDAPTLQKFSYHSASDGSSTSFSTNSNPTIYYHPVGSFTTNNHVYFNHPSSRSSTRSDIIPLLPLLRQSRELQKLTIEIPNFMQSDVGALLRAVPSITDLVIGYEDMWSDGKSIESYTHPNYDQSGTLIQDRWSFSDLVVNKFSGHLARKSTPLLPRLKSLVISSQTVQVSDKILFDLIASRMTSSAVAPLERVRVVLFRERERDIQTELTQLAMDVGIKINLDLQYSQPPNPNSVPTSPEYGLKTKGHDVYASSNYP